MHFWYIPEWNSFEKLPEINLLDVNYFFFIFALNNMTTVYLPCFVCKLNPKLFRLVCSSMSSGRLLPVQYEIAFIKIMYRTAIC